MEEVKAWLESLYAPAIAVAASSAAETLLQTRNGLSVVDLLRPFGFVPQLNGELTPV
jgi:hypothetical protein